MKLRTAKTVAITLGIMAAIYAGYVHDIIGARRLVTFTAVITGMASLFSLSDEVKEKARKKGRAMPRWFAVSTDLIIMLSLAWFGAWVSAICWMLSLGAEEIIFETKDDKGDES